MRIVIVESPNKIKTIQGYLHSLGYTDTTVLASYGHVTGLKQEQTAIDVENNFAFDWHDKPNSHVTAIRTALKSASGLIIATDMDREGESIGDHIVRLVKPKVPVSRIVFTSITKSAIKHAMENPIHLRQELVDAYKARTALDFLVGFYLSPVLWKKLPTCKSAGRVQSAILNIITEHEYEREQFKSQQYYVADGEFTFDDHTLRTKLALYQGQKYKYFDIADKSQLIEQIQEQTYRLIDVQQIDRYSNPPAPFITSSLQQAAANTLGYSPAYTMSLAQQLYEGIQLEDQRTGLITYMRTDSVSMQAKDEALAVIRQTWGDQYAQRRDYVSKGKNAQEAHECIRPADFRYSPAQIASYLTDQQLKLYTLIYNRALASQMSSYQFKETTYQIANDTKDIVFEAKGQVTTFDGYKVLYNVAEDSLLPEISVGTKLTLSQLDLQDKMTTPPARFTAASLIAKMEECGIGRPSTYSSMVDKLMDRGYVELDDKKLYPSARSWFLNAFLQEFFNKYIQASFTSDMEDKLDQIAAGKASWIDVVREFWLEFKYKIDSSQAVRKQDISQIAAELYKDHFFKEINACPICAHAPTVVFYKGSYFLSCNECKWTNIKEHVIDLDPITGQQILLKTGIYGPYLHWPALHEHPDKRVAVHGLTDIDLALAMQLKSIPKYMGEYNEHSVTVGLGRFGFYILHNKQYYSVKQSLDTLSLEDCITIINTPKNPKRNVGRRKRKVSVKRSSKQSPNAM